METGIAAVDCGADAVYIGATRFGARHAASNSVDDVGRLVDYAHRYGVRVYATLNTLLRDDEVEAARTLALQLQGVGVDALITQDEVMAQMGLTIALHASTQMDNRSAEQVRVLYERGYEQVVLARELSLQETRAIHETCPGVRLEAFVHGALCVSYSGRCYASEHCFGRSANRGECAQFCRLPFDLEDERGNVVVRGKHLLSLKDMNRSARLEEMMDAGVSSFKIEGRLKDMGYVKNVTAYYRQALDRIMARRGDEYVRQSYGHIHTSFVPDLKKSFNRGFTEYMLDGDKDDLASIDTPKAVGEKVAVVSDKNDGAEKFVKVKSRVELHNGDGLCFFTDGEDDGGHPRRDNGGDRRMVLQGFRVNRVEGDKVFPYPFPKGLRPGMALYRNRDTAFDNEVAKGTTPRTIGVTIRMTDVATTKPYVRFRIEMEAESGVHANIEVETEMQEARTPQAERIKKELAKLGDTPYEATGVTLLLHKDYFVPASLLGQWRRRLVNELTRQGMAQTKVSQPTDSGVEWRYAGIDTWPGEGREHRYLTSDDVEALMTCRYCIRRMLGRCGQDGKWCLVLGDGRRFPLVFDCRRCEMKVMKNKD